MQRHFHRFSLMIAAVLFLCAGLAACVSLPGQNAPAAVIYQLHPSAQPLMAQAPALPASLRLGVAPPHVPPGYERDRIALARDDGRRLDYYSGARWAAPLPRVLSGVITQSLRTSLPGGVIDESETLPAATHELRVTVLSFTPVYGSTTAMAPRIDVSLRFVLLRHTDQAIVSDITLRRTLHPKENTLSAITTGLEEALHGVMADALPRLAQSLSYTERPRKK